MQTKKHIRLFAPAERAKKIQNISFALSFADIEPIIPITVTVPKVTAR